MEQKFVIEDINSFNPTHIFECGQCFRWNKEIDESYTGVIKNGVLNVKKTDNKILITGNIDTNLADFCTEYFDLSENYNDIKEELSKIDDFLNTSIKYGYGIRILKQDLWETIISFIISANNNIPRIKSIIERLSKAYGQKIIFNNKKYYCFPTPEGLSKASVADLRLMGLGFRDERVYETTQKILNKEIDLKKLENEKDTQKVRDILLTLPGIGPKVADCILLFAMKRYKVFPIDVWVRRVMNELYNSSEIEMKPKEILKLANEKYGNLAGFAQQYLFYWRRELE